MKKVVNFIYKNGKYKIAIPVLIVGFILQAILIIKYLPEFLNYSNNIKNPDQLFSYNLDYITNLYQILEEQGRKFYFEMLSIDFLYTIISGMGFSLLLAALVKKRKWYIVLPLFLSLSDICENISQIVLMNNFPEITTFGVFISSTFSTAKMLLSLMSVSLILFFLVKNLVQWIKRNNQN